MWSFYLLILPVIGAEGRFTVHKRSLGQSNIFTSVCHSVHGRCGGGGRVCIQGDLHPGGSCIQEGLHLGGLHTGGICIEGVCVADTPCIQWDTMGYSQQVGGTHPPEMHSCLRKCSLLFVQCHGKFSCSPVANNGKAHSKILFLKTYG